MTPAGLNDLIRQRRSVFPKSYSSEPVDDEVINQMLENANWAPTHKLTEPWRFVVFSGHGLTELAELQAGYYEQFTRRDGTYNEGKHQNLRTKPLLSSHIIVIVTKRDPGKSLPVIEEAGAVFCAIQNMYLTAAAYGVGCYLSTGGITYFPGAQELFGFDRDDVLIGFLHVGRIKETPAPGKRKPVTDKTRWVKS